MDQLGEWLDSSKVSEFQLCPRKFYYRHERHLVPYEHDASINWANPMTFGSGLHAALASYYDNSAFVESTCPCPDICVYCEGKKIPRILAQFLIHYPDDPTDDRDPRTRDRGLLIIREYLKKWGREPFKVIGTEMSFALEFEGFNYIGRVDLLVEEDGKIRPDDHKSTTRFGMMFEQQFKVSHQMTGYMQGVAKALGIDITEGEINALRVTANISEDSFLRLTTTRTPEDFEEWHREVEEIFLDIKRCREREWWPKHAPYACSAYNRTCEYYNLCASGASAREEMIKRSYIVQPWKPVED